MKEKEQEKTGPNNSQLPSNAANEPTPIYFTDDNNLQTPEEYELHKKKQAVNKPEKEQEGKKDEGNKGNRN